MRNERRAKIASIIETVTTTRTTGDWIAALSDAGVPCGRINDLAHVFAVPHLAARGLFAALPHPPLGSVRAIGSPLPLSDTPPVMRRAAPLLGEHHREALAWGGSSALRAAI